MLRSPKFGGYSKNLQIRNYKNSLKLYKNEQERDRKPQVRKLSDRESRRLIHFAAAPNRS